MNNKMNNDVGRAILLGLFFIFIGCWSIYGLGVASMVMGVILVGCGILAVALPK
jgi:hypothetical protein